jgi:hypothetical protein
MDLHYHAFLDGKLDQRIEEFKERHLPIENEDLGLYAESSILTEMESFKRMKDQLREVETSIARKQKEIFQGIQPIPLTSKEKEPVEVLGNMMAISFYKDVDKDLKSKLKAFVHKHLYTFTLSTEKISSRTQGDFPDFSCGSTARRCTLCAQKRRFQFFFAHGEILRTICGTLIRVRIKWYTYKGMDQMVHL